MDFKEKYKSKGLRIVVVEQVASVRQVIVDILRGFGFSNVESMATITDATNLLEAEPIDWIILPLYANEQPNGLHTVRVVASFQELRGTKVSLLLDDNEEWVIPKAFELGLLSYHKKLANREGLLNEFQALIKTFDQFDGDATKTAASYLRGHLRNSKQTEDLLALEKSLLDLFPGDGDNLINLAEAQLLCGFPTRAFEILQQAELVCPEKADLINSLRLRIESTNKQTPAEQKSSSDQPSQNILALKNVVLIDHDDATRTAVRSILKDIGCSEIQDFSDGESAFRWIEKNPEPGLIIMEWRIPKLSGPILLQRLRSKEAAKSPIIILSSLIKASDLPFIRELGVANLASKPLEKTSFLKTLVWTIQQDRTPSDLQAMENKIRALLNNKSITESESLIEKYMNNPLAHVGKKAIMKAELAYAKEQYVEARNLAIDAVRHAGESLFALNILGKCLMTLREYQSALKCFKKAQSISPMNLERLVAIAEVQAELGETADAKESLIKAKDIDPENRLVAEGVARVAIASGSDAEAKSALASLDSNINLIRYLNNKAVAHAKCGFAAEGLEIYEKTISAIPRGEHELIAVVRYNTALARIRRADLKGALTDLARLLSGTKTRITKKAESLNDRLKEAIDQGKAFTLTETDSVPQPALGRSGNEEDVEQRSQALAASNLINTMLDLRPGDHCCYLIFRSTAVESAELKKAMSTPPKFKPRKSLERGESFKGSAGIKVAS